MGKEEGGVVAGAFWSFSPVVVITSSCSNDPGSNDPGSNDSGRDGAEKIKVNGQIAVTVVTSSIIHEVPRLLVGIWKGNYTHELISNSGAFTVHLLRKDQLELVKNFGFYTGRERKKFKGVPYRLGITGSPILNDAHSYAECKIINAMDGGDMTAFLANVIDGGILSSGSWMTLNDFYSDAPHEWILEYGEKLSRSASFSMSVIHKIDYSPWKPARS